MSKNHKLIFRFSIVINIILLAAFAWGLIHMNFTKGQVVVTEVQKNLVELKG